ncbi:acyl carrier protein [bacterium]|nr:acyl carrier protein [bacterium]
MSRTTREDARGLTARAKLVALRTIGKHVDVLAPLMVAGCTSLGAVRLAKSLSAEFSMDLPATLVFDHPTLGAIVHLVAGMDSLENSITNFKYSATSSSETGCVVTGMYSTGLRNL